MGFKRALHIWAMAAWGIGEYGFRLQGFKGFRLSGFVTCDPKPQDPSSNSCSN